MNADRTVLDVERTPVGLEADLLEAIEVAQPALDAEVVRVVDCRPAPQGAALLEVLPDARTLAGRVQRRQDAVGDDALDQRYPAQRAFRVSAGRRIEMNLRRLHEVRVMVGQVLTTAARRRVRLAGAGSCAVATAPLSSSFRLSRTVLRDIPVASTTQAMPPWPNARASTHRHRERSSRTASSATYLLPRSNRVRHTI